MDNIAKLTDVVGDYLQREFDGFYTFDLWKKVLIALSTSPDSATPVELLDRFGKELKPRNIQVDVRATADEWAPTLHVEFVWSFDELEVAFRVIVVKAEIFTVQMLDMFQTHGRFGDHFDYAREFEKSVVLMNALRS